MEHVIRDQRVLPPAHHHSKEKERRAAVKAKSSFGRKVQLNNVL